MARAQPARGAKPRANRSPGGQEVPTLIALSLDGNAPRLKAVYNPSSGLWRYFGPYLGGDRARLALSAFHAPTRWRIAATA